MSTETYWNLLVLFVVLCQGIAGTLSRKDIDETSELFVRHKRVINRVRDWKEPIANAAYVVSVKQLRSHDFCVGVILTQSVVLTAPQCIKFNLSFGRVYSGSARRAIHTYGSHFSIHQITDKREIINNHPNRTADGIALLIVSPLFVYSINTRSIQLAEGHTQHGLNGTVSGWGCNAMGDHGTAHPDYLRSITVPIITNRECATLYEHYFAILDNDICTFDVTGNQYCGVNDAGAPLVIKDVHNMDKLTGILIRSGIVAGRAFPDIFANVQHPIYRMWIADNIRSLNQNHHTST